MAIYIMGFFDFLRRKKAENELDDPSLPTGPAYKFSAGMDARQARRDVTQIVPMTGQSPEVQMELMRTQLENVRMQYEAISSRLQNIERIVTEIRGFWK